jgi:hypothetical protein
MTNQQSSTRNSNNTVMYVFMAFMAAVILFLIFRKDTKPETSADKLKIEMIEKKVATLEDQVKGWENERKKSDSNSALLVKELIGINKSIIASRDNQKIIIRDHDAIPNIVRNLSVEQRYREFVGAGTER